MNPTLCFSTRRARRFAGVGFSPAPWSPAGTSDGFNPFDPMGFDPFSPYNLTPPTPPAGDQITLTVGKSSIVLHEDGTVTINGALKITINGDVDINGILKATETKTVVAAAPVQPDPSQPPKKPQQKDWFTDLFKDHPKLATSVATGGMTMAADLLSGQKVGWSLLGGVISGVTAKDGWVSDKLGTAIESPSIANFMLGTAGAAATGATTAVATGASVTAGVSASVATSFKGSGPTLTTPPKDPPPADGKDNKTPQAMGSTGTNGSGANPGKQDGDSNNQPSGKGTGTSDSALPASIIDDDNVVPPGNTGLA